MRSFYLGLAFVLLASTKAFGASTTWFVEGEFLSGSFGGAGTFFGQFDFDDETFLYSNVAIEVQDASFNLIFFDDTSINPAFTNDSFLDLVVDYDALGGSGLSGQPLLSLNFESFLDPFGGPVGLGPDNGAVSIFGECDSDLCDTAFGEQLTGIATPNPVPLPAAAWLLGSALLGLGVLKRKPA